MTIEILPAQLANQIAAGEVVERPASVIKELVENSLDAGASNLIIDVEKGGVKKIRISDNGKGIAKDELKLALSRHATSKIKTLSDLEAIGSLGFRGEALASISSVSRLTLTSKPAEQEMAWQAHAEGRDMTVTVQPAAHSNGTTIEVIDLFFNTPARRKFLRTEKTEFNHIDEVIRRIALANFSVSFTLTHNGKIIRQYRSALTKAQQSKRVAMICGNKFIEQAIEINCHHDNMVFTGWLATAQFYRKQNDLNYSYVNGRMMRDKLINHAIRQAYADLLPPDTYPAFVLFFQLDNRDVDVNVHPAKHEVRFHQSRYVHDFIFSVCQKTLTEQMPFVSENDDTTSETASNSHANQLNPLSHNVVQQHSKQHSVLAKPSAPLLQQPAQSFDYSKATIRPSYVQPLQKVSDVAKPNYAASLHSGTTISATAVKNYQQLMTPIEKPLGSELNSVTSDQLTSGDFSELPQVLFVKSPGYAVIILSDKIRVLSLFKLAQQSHVVKVRKSWQQGIISQPLLLPVSVQLNDEQFDFIQQYSELISQSGVVLHLQTNKKIQIRQFPAMLRAQNVSECVVVFIAFLLDILSVQHSSERLTEHHFCQAIAHVLVAKEYNAEQAVEQLAIAHNLFTNDFIRQLNLNSVVLDLTSEIKQLTQVALT